jgi:signal transduction histidine kinase
VIGRTEVVVGGAGIAIVLAILLARPPGWDLLTAALAIALVPVAAVLVGVVRRSRRELEGRSRAVEIEAAEADRARKELGERVAELVTINEVAVALSSTLDLDDLFGRSLQAVVSRLRFDRALILLIDEDRQVLTAGRSIGGSDEMAGLVAGFELPLAETRSTLVQLARADGPMLFRDVDQDEFEPNRAFARAVGVTSFLGTPLITQGRTVGMLAVDNRLTGRDLERSAGPLLFTVGNLIAGAIERARLYGEIEADRRDLEMRVARRTEQLAQAVEEAQDARAEAEEASETKSRFLANVSHELRTPLTSVIGFTKLVRKRLEEVVFPSVPEGAATTDPRLERAMRQVSENLAIMVAEGDRLTALINEVLDLEKIRAGRMEFRSELVDVADVVRRAAAATAALFETSGLALAVDAGGPLSVVGDRDRLIQVVINLLSNAVKFTPSGSVHVGARMADAEVLVSVTDTGVGIDPADQARVFEPFAQAEDALAAGPRGTGLGLPICRQIVEHHGGRLWLVSAVGAGSTFTFALPAADAEPHADPGPDLPTRREEAGTAHVGP